MGTDLFLDKNRNLPGFHSTLLSTLWFRTSNSLILKRNRSRVLLKILVSVVRFRPWAPTQFAYSYIPCLLAKLICLRASVARPYRRGDQTTRSKMGSE